MHKSIRKVAAPVGIQTFTGLGKKVVPRLCECCRQSQAEVVSKSSNKIHQTWGPPFSQTLYNLNFKLRIKSITLKYFRSSSPLPDDFSSSGGTNSSNLKMSSALGFDSAANSARFAWIS